MNSDPFASKPRLNAAAAVLALLVTTIHVAHAAPDRNHRTPMPGAIRTDDGTASLSIDDVKVVEGQSGTTLAIFTVSLLKPGPDSAFVSYQTFDSTATVANHDYVPTSGRLAFPPDSTTATLTVDVSGDLVYEPDELFGVILLDPDNATIADQLGVGAISNDDSAPTLSIGDVTVTERDTVSRNAVFTVSLSNPTAEAVTVDYQTADGTATLANGDYLETHGTLTIPAKALGDTIAVVVVGDTKFEPNENFLVNLSNPSGATILDGQGIGTIQNDDTRPTISINDVSVIEGNSGTVAAVFTIFLSNPSASTISVNYRTLDNTATLASNDYVATNGSVTFPPKTLSATVTVLVNGDLKFELDERFRVSLTGPVNASIARPQGTGTIVNDDPLPQVSIADVSQPEGDEGTTEAWFMVTLSNPSERPVTVTYQTGDGTATLANGDYIAKNAVLSIPLVAAVDTIKIEVVGDTKDENDETFFVNLMSANGGVIADSQAVCTIIDDDGVPSVGVVEEGKNEGDEGFTDMIVKIALSNPTALETVEVDYHTEDGTATLANSDYIATSGHLVFPPKVAVQTFTIQLIGDVTRENWETIQVILSNPVNASLPNPVGLETIQDDDAEPLFFVNDVTQAEGSGGQTAFVFSVTLSTPSEIPVVIQYATEDVTAKAGQPDLDFVQTEGTLVFEPKSLKSTITVLVNADVHDEPEETFILRLKQPLHGTIRDQAGIGTILDDDPAAPHVTVMAPNGGEYLVVGQTIELTWSAESDVGVTSVDLLVSYDTGNSYQTIALGEENDGSYEWEVTRPPGDPPTSPIYALFRVVAHAPGSDPGEDTSDHYFSIIDPTLLGAHDAPVTEFALSPLAPNPSAGRVAIEYALPRAASIRVSLIDVQGREMAVLADGTTPPGRHRVVWDGSGRGARAGMYFVRYTTPARSFIRKLVLSK